MSEQEQKPDEAGRQESRFLPQTHIEAEEIKATNVVSGVQNITNNYLQGQEYSPPLQRPRRAEHFQDRVSERAWLLDKLHLGQIVTLCGPGGMGKTALVAEVLWTLVPGDSPPAAFPHGIVFHSFYGRPDAAVALEQLARTFGEDPLPTPAEAARRALGGRRALLILDGAEEAENLEQVLSVCASCAVLVTSRRRSDAADPALLLDLQRLPQDEAVAVVQAWQAQRQADEAVTLRICQLVGGLPLALRLAGSYLALHLDEGGEYLVWLEEDLLGALDQGSSSRKSVSVLLERSVARLRPEAQAVLRLVGLLALAPFTRALVAGVLEFSTAAARRALDELVDYGLLVRVGASYEVSHPLIYTYARQELLAQDDPATRYDLVERVVRVLNDRFPEVEFTTWAQCEALLPHVQACATLLEEQGLVLLEACRLLNRAGWYLRERGLYAQSAVLLQLGLTCYEQVADETAPELGSLLNNLAALYRVQGKYPEAEPLYQRALVICEQQLGPTHSSTATSLNNLAELYRAQGKYAEAEPLYQRALAICEQQLGASHPTTRIIRENYTTLLQVFSPGNEQH